MEESKIRMCDFMDYIGSIIFGIFRLIPTTFGRVFGLLSQLTKQVISPPNGVAGQSVPCTRTWNNNFIYFSGQRLTWRG